MTDLINLDDDVKRYQTRPANEWKVDDVCEFLSALELNALLPTVKENAVDGAMLVELSDSELEKDLGFKPLQIKKLKRGLQAHTAAPSAPAAAPQPKPTAAAPAKAVVHESADGARSADAIKTAAAAEAVHGASATAARFAAARDLLGTAYYDLQAAQKQLQQAMTSQAVNTGAGGGFVHRGGLFHPPRNPGIEMATAAMAKRHCQGAHQLSEKASRTIQQARTQCPELPPIKVPNVKIVGGIVMQSLFDGGLSDAVRLSKIREAEVEIARCAAEVKLAYERCGATSNANASYAAGAAGHHSHTSHSPAYAAAPPAYGYPDPYANPPLQPQQQVRGGGGLLAGMLIGEAMARPRVEVVRGPGFGGGFRRW